MDGITLLRRMIDFDRWASARMHESIAPLESSLTKAVTLQAHIYRGWEAWMDRVEKIESKIEWFPELSLAEAEQIGRAAEKRWDKFLESLSGDWTERKYEANLLDGRRAEFTLSEIILQLVSHGAHHRGQINTLVRGAGGEPVNPTFMRYVVGKRG